MKNKWKLNLEKASILEQSYIPVQASNSAGKAREACARSSSRAERSGIGVRIQLLFRSFAGYLLRVLAINSTEW